MTAAVLDVNLWLPLTLGTNQKHATAVQWFGSLPEKSAGMPRIVQLGVTRLLGNSHVSGTQAMPAAAAWRTVQDLVEFDERVVFLPEPEDIALYFPLMLKFKVPTSNLVTDAYLAAFARTMSVPLVTFDRGFRQFAGLRVEVLGE